MSRIQMKYIHYSKKRAFALPYGVSIDEYEVCAPKGMGMRFKLNWSSRIFVKLSHGLDYGSKLEICDLE